MRTNERLFKRVFRGGLSALLLLASCESSDNVETPEAEPEVTTEIQLTKFSVEAGGKTYEATLSSNSTAVTISGVEYGSLITGVDYEVTDVVKSVEPAPSTLIGDWDEYESIILSDGEKSVTYTIRLLDYDADYPIKQYGDIVVHTEAYYGNTITEYYYDIKYLTKWVQSEEMARELFVEDKMNGVRIPILGTDAKPAHPSAGVVESSMYDWSVSTVENARAVIGDQDFTIFASKKLDGQTSFPDWTKDDDGVIASEYTTLLIDYILHMKGRGIEIDVLGIDNEAKYNEGNIPPQKHYDIVNLLRAAALVYDFKMPLIIGPEEYEPVGNSTCWVKELYDLGYSDYIDIYGTHYYPRVSRNKEELTYELNIVGSKPFWATEPHWDNDDEAQADMLTASEMAICTLWDQTDLGMCAFMWWGYERSGSLKGCLTKAVSTPLLNSQPISVYDVDGEDIMTAGKLQTRAFRDGNTIHLFVLNVAPIDSTSGKPSYLDYTIGIDAGQIDGEIACTQWRDDTADEGEASVLSSISDNQFKFDFPVRSITIFSFNLK